MIPPRNIYYMLLYAWGHYRGGQMSVLGDDDSPNLPTLLARVLNFHTRRLLRAGLDRGYLNLQEEGRRVRGRLLLGEMVKRQTVKLRGLAVYEFDELTPDVLHNRILLETLVRLSKSPRVDAETKHEVGLTARRFRDVSRVHLTPSLFGRVTLSRNTAQYRLLMDICSLLLRELMPDSDEGNTKFQALADDEVRMEALFEEFLRSFYRLELPDVQVSAKEYTWSTGQADLAAVALLPKMRTDITLRSRDCALTIEAKFNKEILVASQYGSGGCGPLICINCTVTFRMRPRRTPADCTPAFFSMRSEERQSTLVSRC
jgi:5-methylcytosine-specific restriction enzyme subunit McrC